MSSPTKNIIVLFLSVVLFNYSVRLNDDVPGALDHNVESISPTVRDNGIESVFELVTEEWLDIEDCVPEQTHDDAPEDGSVIKQTNLLFPISILTLRRHVKTCLKIYYSYFTPNTTQWMQAPSTPPPDMLL